LKKAFKYKPTITKPEKKIKKRESKFDEKINLLNQNMQIFKVKKDQPKLQNLTFLKKKKIIEEDFEDFIQINRHKLGNKVKIIELNPKVFSEANYHPMDSSEDKIQIKKEIFEQDSSVGLKEESVSVITE